MPIDQQKCNRRPLTPDPLPPLETSAHPHGGTQARATAKSILREKLKMLDRLGTMGAFTLGQKGRPGASNVEEDLNATHLTRWIRENSQQSRTRIRHATTIANPPTHKVYKGPISLIGESPSTILSTYSTCPRRAFSGKKTAPSESLNGTLLYKAPD